MLTATNPYSGEKIADYPSLDQAAMSDRIGDANKAFESWQTKSFAERADVLRAVAKKLREQKPAIAKLMADKTNWRAMLKGDGEPIPLKDKVAEVAPKISEILNQVRNDYGEDSVETLNENIVDIRYPVEEYPVKISSFNFDKMPEVSGTLKGIKGQYLIFDTGVINIRKFTGYEVRVEH